MRSFNALFLSTSRLGWLVLAMCCLWVPLQSTAQQNDRAPKKVTQELAVLDNADRATLTLYNAKAKTTFTLKQLEALGMYEVTTSTFWPDDNGTYQGPLLSDVLKAAGLDQNTVVRIAAVDGFSQRIPQEDWTRWPLVLATRRDGKAMDTRHKGPLRLIYPRDMHAELQLETYRLRWVWMVNRIDTQTRP